MAPGQTILVVAETDGTRISPVTLELLTAAREVIRSAGEGAIEVVLAGASVRGLADEMAGYALDRVYFVDHIALSEFQPRAYADVVETAVRRSRPDLLILSETPTGRDLAPRLAARFNTGIVKNCIQVEPQPDGSLSVVCPALGGDARAVYRFDDATPRIVTIQAHAFPTASPQGQNQTEPLDLTSDLAELQSDTTLVQRTSAGGPRIEEASILVGGGRGLGTAENFAIVEELAAVLGGLPAATRAIVDVGWATPAQQIGLTGKYVAPKLYIAAGVSGASQHLAGLSAAGTIVAIDMDPAAPIFARARYGVLANCLEFLPAFIRKCRELRDR